MSENVIIRMRCAKICITKVSKHQFVCRQTMGSAETYNLIRRRERRNCEKRDASWCLRLASIPVLIKSVAFAILKKRRSASCPRTAPTLRLCTALHGPMRDQACPGDAGHATHDAELSGKKQWTGDNYRGSVMAWKARLPTGHPPHRHSLAHSVTPVQAVGLPYLRASRKKRRLADGDDSAGHLAAQEAHKKVQ